MDFERLCKTFAQISRELDKHKEDLIVEIHKSNAGSYRDPRILAEEEENIYALIRSVVNLKKNRLISKEEMQEILNRIQQRCSARAIFFSMPFEMESSHD